MEDVYRERIEDTYSKEKGGEASREVKGKSRGDALGERTEKK